MFYLSAMLLVAAFALSGAFIGARGSKRDFSLGGRSAGCAGVTGILLGALVGGASTVGTTQMAYKCGASAWWFTLGGGIACFLLGLRFAVPIRKSSITTIADFLERSYGLYGRKIAYTATISSSIGTFISICAQFLSCIALISGAFPVPAWAAAGAAALAISGFIASGGMKSYSKLGTAKIVILYIVLIACGIAAYGASGGVSAVFDELGFHPWFNIFGRGFFPEIGYFASMIVGVFTTQIYIQSLAAARDEKTARAGAFASALLMPPMGIFGCYVGLSVRASGVEVPAQKVLTWFIMHSFSPVVGGLIWGGILITVIGCAAGLILGISTNITKNIIPEKFKRSFDADRIQQVLVVAMIIIAAVTGLCGGGTMILELSFLSMGLRGAGTFFPFVAAIMRPGCVKPKFAFFASAGGLAAMLAAACTGVPFDPLFAGLAVSALFVSAGIIL